MAGWFGVFSVDSTTISGAPPAIDVDELADATVVVEVLSPSTATRDDTYQRWGYLSLPSLGRFVLIDPDKVEIADRGDGGRYSARVLRGGDKLLELPAIGFSVALGKLYRD